MKIPVQELINILLQVEKKSNIPNNELSKKSLISFYFKMKNVKINTNSFLDNIDDLTYLINLPKAYLSMRNKNYWQACDEIADILHRSSSNNALMQLRDRNVILLCIEEGLRDEMDFQKEKTKRKTIFGRSRLFPCFRKNRIIYRT